MKSMGGPPPHHRPFNIAVHTTKLDVDNRFSLNFYRRTAENLLKQAHIYREEKNIVELYILLLRYSSLVGETIPEHQHYRTCPPKQKVEYRKKLAQVLDELELLKPEVQKQVEQINNSLADNSGLFDDNSSSVYEWPPRKRHTTQNTDRKSDTTQNIDNEKKTTGFGFNGPLQCSTLTSKFTSMSVGDQLQNLSFNLPIPKEETLSRHSFLGSSGLRGQLQIPRIASKVQYPSYIETTPIQVPSVEESWSKLSSDLSLDPLIALNSESASLQQLDARPFQENKGAVEPTSLEMSLSAQPSPPVIAAQVQNIASLDITDPMPVAVPSLDQDVLQNKTQDMAVHVPPWDVADPRPGPAASSTGGLSQSKGPKRLHISVHMMDEFLKLAKHNTNQNLETCGVLAGSLRKGVFFITTLIVPKQQATSDSCQTVNEEEIFDCQDKRSLFQLGWIHTHPTQTCFMSSIDLHTHYSYQVMLPEAVAIVMAPTDASRKYGIFRLSDPGGIKVIQQCQMRGFHPHEEPPDGGPIYEHCSNVFIDPKLKFQVIDLR